jgi:putative metallohydrolase (TIGR04338 family)
MQSTDNHWNPYHYPEIRKDNGRLKVYRAEWALKKELDEELMTNKQMADYLRSIKSSKWFKDRFGSVVFHMQFSGRRCRSAACSFRLDRGFTLKFPGNGSMNDRLTALHELAHVICHKQKHGAIYCAVLLQLVGHYMGWVVGDKLRSKFITEGVHFVRS